MTTSAALILNAATSIQFANSEALFPPADLAKTISAEYDANANPSRKFRAGLRHSRTCSGLIRCVCKRIIVHDARFQHG